jgi:hypothetical protein
MSSRPLVQQLIDGYRISQIVCVAAEFGVADLLKAGPRTWSELAAQTGAHPTAFHRLMRALCGLGVFTPVPPDSFALNAASEWLLSGAPQSLRPWALASLDQWYGAWGELRHTLKTGETAFDHLHGMDAWSHRRENQDSGRLFNDAMSAAAAGVASAVLRAYDFSRFNTIVDVGGGDGTFMAALLQAYPDAKGIVFDRFPCAGPAQSVAGDFFEAVPAGGDCYLLSRVLHDWNDEDAVRILHNVGRAMDGPRTVLLVERLLDGDASTEAALSDINMMVMNGGRERTLDEFRALLASTGFALSRVLPTDAPVFLIEAVSSAPHAVP